MFINNIFHIEFASNGVHINLIDIPFPHINSVKYFHCKYDMDFVTEFLVSDTIMVGSDRISRVVR